MLGITKVVEDSLEEVIWDQVGWAWECSSIKLKELRRLVHILQQHKIYSCIYKDIYMFGITDKVRSLKYKTKDHNNILWTKQLDKKCKSSFFYFMHIFWDTSCYKQN